jgi:hypothetical protein
MGWRVTAQNLNLNRDYMKAVAPEMEAMLHLLNAWDPILYVDLHVTDGAQFQYDVANLVEPFLGGDPALQPLGRALMDDTNARVAAGGGLPLPFYFYPSLRDGNDPASGFAFEAYPPRFSTGYWALNNRLAMLVETHSWKDYRTRVRVTHDIFVAVADLTARDGRAWLQAAHESDAKARALGGTNVPLALKTTDRHHIIDFKGYAYTREPSAASGALALHYDPKVPQIWHIPFYDEMVASVEETAPTGGYVVPPRGSPGVLRCMVSSRTCLRKIWDPAALRSSARTKLTSARGPLRAVRWPRSTESGLPWSAAFRKARSTFPSHRPKHASS